MMSRDREGGDRDRNRDRDRDRDRPRDADYDRLQVIEDKKERVSLSDRLAAMPALARFSVCVLISKITALH